MDKLYYKSLNDIFCAKKTIDLETIIEKLVVDITKDKNITINELVNFSINYFIDLKNSNFLESLFLIIYSLSRHPNQKFRKLSLKYSNLAYSISYHMGNINFCPYLYKGIANLSNSRDNIGIKFINIFLSKQKEIAAIEKVIAFTALGEVSLKKFNLKNSYSFFYQSYSIINTTLEGKVPFKLLIINLLLGILLEDNSINEFKDKINHNKKNFIEYELDFTTLIEIIEKIILKNEVKIKELESQIVKFANYNDYLTILTDKAALFPGAIMNINLSKTLSKKQLNLSELLGILVSFYFKLIKPEQYNKVVYHFSYWNLNKLVQYIYKDIKSQDCSLYYKSLLSSMISEDVLNYIESEKYEETRVVDSSIALFLDIVGYSKIVEKIDNAEIINILSPFFNSFSKCIYEVNGSILEFIGDSVYAVFNTFNHEKVSIIDILYQCVIFLDEILLFRTIDKLKGLPDLNIGIGIKKGPAIIGDFGVLNRSHISVLGNTVNIASRLESLTRNIPARIAISIDSFEYDIFMIWAKPNNVNFSIRRGGANKLKNISKEVDIYAIDSLVKFWVDFVPMGYVAYKEEGIVYIDTGGSLSQTIIDHHHETMKEGSACGSFMKDPEYFLSEIRKIDSSFIEFRLHSMPDFDCISTFYVIQEFLLGNPRIKLLEKLSAYVSQIDQGFIPEPEFFNDSIFGIFVGQLSTLKNNDDYNALLEGLKVIDAAMFIAESINEKEVDFSSIFKNYSNIFTDARKMLNDDLAHYKQDCKNGFEYDAYVIKQKNKIKVKGLCLKDPKSSLFKMWTRNPVDGKKRYEFLTIHLTSNNKNRYIISIDPESQISLMGLGEFLEKHEKEKREKLNLQRPINPIRYPSDNSDPWYFGQGHNYTIIDSPFCGSILSIEEIVKIHSCWE